MQEPLRRHQHLVKDRPRCRPSCQLEARRRITFRGLRDGADGPACCTALLAAPQSWQGRFYAGSGPEPRGRQPECPHCGAAHEDKAHILWDCQEWGNARGTWLSWLNNTAGAISSLGSLNRWPSCLRKASLFPGAGGGPGPLRRVPTPPLWHVLGGPRGTNGGSAQEISWDTATPSSRSSRVGGPAAPNSWMPSLAPYRGMPSASSRDCSRDSGRTGGSPRISTTTWSGWHGC